MQDTDVMIGIGGRSWRFSGAQIEGDTWEGEWRSDGRLYLHDGIGSVVEGTELSEAALRRGLGRRHNHGCAQ
jgi:hypothetical protein